MNDTFKSTRDVILQTRDWEAALKFYGETLGLPMADRFNDIVGFEAGGFRLYLEKGELAGPVHEFLVPDVQGAKRRLLEAGCVVVEEDPSVSRCYLRDPFGLVFNLGRG